MPMTDQRKGYDLGGSKWGPLCAYLDKTPPRIAVGSETFHRIDDPETGEVLGYYIDSDEVGQATLFEDMP